MGEHDRLCRSRSGCARHCRVRGLPADLKRGPRDNRTCLRQAGYSQRLSVRCRASSSEQRTSQKGRLRPFDVVSSGRSTSLWHRQASSGCFRDFDPANGRRPTSAVPRKPVVGGAIFRLPVRPVVAESGCSGRRIRRHFADVQAHVLTGRFGASSSESRQSAVGQERPLATGSFLDAAQIRRQSVFVLPTAAAPVPSLTPVEFVTGSRVRAGLSRRATPHRRRESRIERRNRHDRRG